MRTAVWILLWSAGCGGSHSSAQDAGFASDVGVGVDSADSCAADPSMPDDNLGGGVDPAAGSFTLDQALAGLPAGPGPLRAIITTEMGTLTCTLRGDKAPNAVANFVGLARGVRPWLDTIGGNVWRHRRFYDGLTFHRVIADFIIQGGDPLGTGTGGPGYTFADEISDLVHAPGTLAYANSGANTNGSQYYITQTAQPSLDGRYTIFGLCTPVSLVTTLDHVATDANDRPDTALHMSSVTITRCAM